MRRIFLLGLLAAAPVVVPGAHAATIVIVNNDGPGEGFNDPTAVAPVGGNPGVTLGAQRLNVFQEAANIWGGLLPSAVTIRVQAQFNPQSCDASSAVLGSAGPIQVFRDFSGAEVAATWYHVALANKLAGVDLSASNDINATFNSAIDNNDNCLANTDWYYGLDGNEGSDVELLPVVLHELGHGLGFSTLVNLGNGSELSGFSDIYERHIRDNTLGLTWDQMTAGERTTSATNTDNVVWNGAGARVNASKFLGGVPTMCVNSPPALPSTIPIGTANFGPALTEAGVTGDVVLVNDGSGTTTDGCEALINGAQVSGNIALIDRGTCAFVTKAQNAQAAGAIAVIIANNVADPDPITLGGTDPTITIPVVSVTLDDGNAIKAQLGTGVNVTLKLDPANLAGADSNGRVKLYAPNPVQGGSSISHWDVSATPSLLMEPAITSILSSDVDLTLAHFADIGWLADCVQVFCPSDTTVPGGSLVELEFCVTNCADICDAVTVTISDSQGWCAPVNQELVLDPDSTGCVTFSCTVPDTCDAASTTITLAATGAAGVTADCTTTVFVSPDNTPPVAQCANVTVSGTGGENCTAEVTPAQVDDGSFDPDGGGVTLALEPAGPYPQGTTPVDLIVTDACDESDTCTALITVTCGGILEVEPALLSLDGVAVGDTVCDSVCVINLGDEELDVDSVNGCGSGGFFLDMAGFSSTIAPGDTSKFRVCYSPIQAGPDTCEVIVSADGDADTVSVHVSGTSGLGDPGGATAFTLAPLFPTPFTASAEIRFMLPTADRVRIEIFDFQGRLVNTVLNGNTLPAGLQAVRWDGRDARGSGVAGGIYFVRVTAAEHGTRVMRAVRLNN